MKRTEKKRRQISKIDKIFKFLNGQISMTFFENFFRGFSWVKKILFSAESGNFE